MNLTIFKLNFRIMFLVLLSFVAFANCESIQLPRQCYDGCTCQTWFGFPACIAAYWYPNLCKCCQGYEMKNFQCVDIDECKMNTSLCDQMCVNTVGSYLCTCRKGYTYNQKQGKCIFAGPCFKEFNFCKHICKPLGTYRYRCECYPGFILASDKISCLSVS